MKIQDETLERMTTTRPALISTCVSRKIYRRASRELMLYGISIDEAIQFTFMRAAREGNVNFLFERIDGYAFERI